jgi:hypothetical protein
MTNAKRFLSVLGACLGLMSFLGSSASAKTVYDYAYSGTFIDGSAVGKPFHAGLAGIAFDAQSNRLTVIDAGEPAVVSRYTSAGAPAPFAALGTAWFSIESYFEPNSGVTIDESGTGNGNFFIHTGAPIQGFGAGGSPLTLNGVGGGCGVAVSPDGKELLYSERGGVYHFDLSTGELLGGKFIGPAGIEPGVKLVGGELLRACHMVFDENGDLYGLIGDGNGDSAAYKLTPDGLVYYMLNHRGDSSSLAMDRSENDVFVLNLTSFEIYDEDGRLLGSGFGAPSGSYPGVEEAHGIAVDPATHDVWVANRHPYGAGKVTHVEKFVRTNPHVIPDTTALPPEYNDAIGEHVVLKGVLNADGQETTECRFEFGTEEPNVHEGVSINVNHEVLDQSVPCQQGKKFSGSEDHVVSAEIPTEKGRHYFVKLVAKNANDQVATSNVEDFVPQGKPIFPGFLAVDRINTDGVRLLTEFEPNGGNATYHFEWGKKGEGFDKSTPESKTFGWLSNPGLFSGENIYLPGLKQVEFETKGLEPGVTYEYRVVITNEAGSVTSPTQEFTTYTPDSGTDKCVNAEVRRQSEGSLLPDCRAYELVSAADQGGFDVESELAPDQSQLDAYPEAYGRFLYSMHFGVLPGISGSPTNLGLDPYLAERGDDGWQTRYVGLPADGMADDGAFGSPLAGADSGLGTFAFGGPNICSPCFGDGSINLPLRRPGGALEEGMRGSPNPPADPVGEVRKPLSGDGSHLIFATDQVFDAAADSGSAWVYDRNLATDSTQLVSTTPAGAPIAGEVAELDVSSDGSHVLIGHRVGEDGEGNDLYDLYMHVGSDPKSIEVAKLPSGVIYDGMTADGSSVFFTATDPLAGDTDSSADLFRADVAADSPAPVSWLSTGSGGAGNTDSCEPVVNWNVPEGGSDDCSVVVPAGGAGVARDEGTVYFISPELLDGAGNGTEDQPNLYVVRSGAAPHYVGEIDSSLGKAPPAPPAHPPLTKNFITTLAAPEGLAIDQATGAVYVAETGEGGRIARYDSSGAPLKFTAGPGVKTNRIPNSEMNPSETEIAFDSSGGFLDGTVYAVHGPNTIVAYARSGALLGELTGFTQACGVAVNQTNGELLVADHGYGGIYRFVPTTGIKPVSKANYSETSIKTEGQDACHLAVDTAGHVFAQSFNPSGGAPLLRYEISDFAGSPPSVVGTEVAASSLAASTNPGTGDLYNDEGNQIVVYDSSGNKIATVGTSATLGSNSNGVAVNGDTKATFALNGSKVSKFGYEVIPYEPIDNPVVVHGVRDAAVQRFGDFQVTPDGHFALFSSPVPLTGYQNLGHQEIYRYDAEAESLACPSCAPTGAVGNSDVKLSPHGLNLVDDGRVFFTTLESFTLRDTNEKRDAYEWDGGKVALISSGIGQEDSALATASADGDDAFFFTRDVLVPTDKNGNVVKVYDARVGGGFPFDPPRGLCKASDECHGAGSQPPPPPDINTGTGPPQARPPVGAKAKRCKKPKVRRKGRCVKKKKLHKRTQKKKGEGR